MDSKKKKGPRDGESLVASLAASKTVREPEVDDSQRVYTTEVKVANPEEEARRRAQADLSAEAFVFNNVTNIDIPGISSMQVGSIWECADTGSIPDVLSVTFICSEVITESNPVHSTGLYSWSRLDQPAGKKMSHAELIDLLENGVFARRSLPDDTKFAKWHLHPLSCTITCMKVANASDTSSGVGSIYMMSAMMTGVSMGRRGKFLSSGFHSVLVNSNSSEFAAAFPWLMSVLR